MSEKVLKETVARHEAEIGRLQVSRYLPSEKPFLEKFSCLAFYKNPNSKPSPAEERDAAAVAGAN